MSDTMNCNATCPCDNKCPLSCAIEMIGGKWKMPIICMLYVNGTMRYNELKRTIGGITNTMLACSLKELEQEGLVKRTQYLEIPPKVEYCLTSKCDDLLPILMSLAKWGKNINM